MKRARLRAITATTRKMTSAHMTAIDLLRLLEFLDSCLPLYMSKARKNLWAVWGKDGNRKSGRQELFAKALKTEGFKEALFARKNGYFTLEA